MARIVHLALPLLLACAAVPDAEPPPAAPPQTEARAEAPTERRLVRTASLSVEMADFEPFDQDLRRWLSDHDGWVSDADLSHAAHGISRARLTLRLPADRLDDWMAWAADTVEIRSQSLSSEDVTARWVDTEARLAVLRSTEQRLLGLLEQQTATLADVLSVEAELARVRGELESMERTMRALSGRVGMASVHLDIRVRQPYASAVVTPLPTQAKAAFDRSAGLMVAAGRGTVILGAALAPWLALLTAFGALLWGLGAWGWRWLGPVAKKLS